MKSSEPRALPTETTPKSIPATSFETLPILLVENGAEDTTFVRSAFNEAKIGNPLHIVKQGEDAVAYLAGMATSEAPDSSLPAIMWLDVQLPRMDGFEVLAWIRQQAHLKNMAVVVLSVNGRMEEADRAYNLGADYFLTKPALFEEWVDRIKTLHEWLVLCHHNRQLESLEKRPSSKMDK